MEQKQRQSSASIGPTERAHRVSRIRPEWVFTALALVAGLFMVFITPPFQSPDESGHFYRAFQLSEGRLIAERQGEMAGGHLPVSLYEMVSSFGEISFKSWRKVNTTTLKAALDQPLENDPREFVNFWNTAIYSPVQYAPQVVGVGLGRIGGLSVLKMMYAGRFLNFACWVAMVFAAIRITPVFKWVMVMIALMPMSVFMAASLSGDVMTNALAFLLVATLLRSAISVHGLIDRRQKMWIVTLCVLVALTKFVYFPLAAFVLLIPAERFGGWKGKAMFCCLAAGAVMVADVAWTWVVHDVVVTIPGNQPVQQIFFILSEPLAYAKVLANTLIDGWWRRIMMFVGVLGWLDTLLPVWVYLSYPAVLVLAALTDKGIARPLMVLEKVTVTAICLAAFFVIVTLQYVTSTGLMEPLIHGIQGRYFIPLAVPMLLLLYNRRINMDEKWLALAALLYCAVVLIVSCVCIVDRYYVLGHIQ